MGSTSLWKVGPAPGPCPPPPEDVDEEPPEQAVRAKISARGIKLARCMWVWLPSRQADSTAALRVLRARRAVRRPQHLGRIEHVARPPAPHEERVGEAVQVLDRLGVHGRVLRERDGAALG